MAKPQKRWHLDDIHVADYRDGAYTLQLAITDDVLERELELVAVNDGGVFSVNDPSATSAEACEIATWLDRSPVAARLLRDAIEMYMDGR